MSLGAAKFCPDSLNRLMFRAFVRLNAIMRPQTVLLTMWPSPVAASAHPIAAPLSSLCFFSSVPARLQQHRGTHVSRCLATASWSSGGGDRGQQFGQRSAPHAPQPVSQQPRPQQRLVNPAVPSPPTVNAMQRQPVGAAPAKGPSADYGIEVKPGAGRWVERVPNGKVHFCHVACLLLLRLLVHATSHGTNHGRKVCAVRQFAA